MQQVPVSLLTLVAGVLVTLVSLWVGQATPLFPEQASEQAPLVDNFFRLMLTIGTALFIVVEGAIVIFMVKFRQKPGDMADGEPLEGNLSLEAFWTLVPAIIVIILGVYSVQVYTEMGGFAPGGLPEMAHHHTHHAPTVEMVAHQEGAGMTSMPPQAKYGIGANPSEGGPADLTVSVSGMQYAWIFNYPDGIISGELHVPVGKRVQLNISALDVIHSFWVPQFRLKQDAIPGQPTELFFVATRVGDYPVVCAELCGAYHGGMRTRAVVHTEEDYAQWVSENRIAQAPLDAEDLAIHLH